MPKTGAQRVLGAGPAELEAAVREAAGGVAGVRWVERLGDFLGALDEEDWGALVLSTSLSAVDDAVVERIARRASSPPLVLTSPDPSVARVLAAEAAGAVELLAEPAATDRLRDALFPLLSERGEIPIGPPPPDDESVVGSDPVLVDAYRMVARVADSGAPVLITGESGTGKELVARALHDQSRRRDAGFIAVNCAAIPENLLEAELFGYERGAFTGAVGRSDGRFGRADGGTLFLDEMGELPPVLQAKLLRALETGELERLGSPDAVRVDVRVVAATNQDLEARVASGAFREDLFWRLAVVRVALPPLRDRGDDILPLATHFAGRFARRYEREVTALSRAAGAVLGTHRWPGNIRELRNVMDRAVLLARGGVIRAADLHLGAGATGSVSDAGGAGSEANTSPLLPLKEVEALHIRRVLAYTGGHMGEAAEILGIHRNTMTVKVREYGIDVPETVQRGG